MDLLSLECEFESRTERYRFAVGYFPKVIEQEGIHLYMGVVAGSSPA